MRSIMDYIEAQNIETVAINNMIKRARYLVSIRKEMEDDLKALGSRLDAIVQEMKDAGIDFPIEEQPR